MKNLKYSKDHIWLCQDGDLVRLGISDYAQASLGVILFLNLPIGGGALEIGEPFGDIESVKTVADLISPVRGTVVRVNEELVDEPDRINEDPYGSWFLEARVEELAEDLMDEAAYQRYQEAL